MQVDVFVDVTAQVICGVHWRGNGKIEKVTAEKIFHFGSLHGEFNEFIMQLSKLGLTLFISQSDEPLMVGIVAAESRLISFKAEKFVDVARMDDVLAKVQSALAELGITDKPSFYLMVD